MLSACLPFSPSFRSNVTRWPCFNVLKPSILIAEKWAKRSSPPSSGVINPYPLASLNHFTVPVEVAADNANREKGLMFRKHLPENSGMLFVMDRSDAVCMWMKNTLIPLSVAFIDKDGFIINIEEMKPLTLDIHCSKAKAFYALEMNESWFEKNHVKPGDKISRLPQLRQTN